MRGQRRKDDLALKENENHEERLGNKTEIIDIKNYTPRRIPPPTWRDCIKKVYEVDPLECPHCKAEMKIIGFDNEPPVIHKILEHLNLWDTPQRQRPPPPRAGPTTPSPGPAEESIQQELFDDGWSGYEESYITSDN